MSHNCDFVTYNCNFISHNCDYFLKLRFFLSQKQLNVTIWFYGQYGSYFNLYLTIIFRWKPAFIHQPLGQPENQLCFMGSGCSDINVVISACEGLVWFVWRGPKTPADLFFPNCEASSQNKVGHNKCFAHLSKDFHINTSIFYSLQSVEISLLRLSTRFHRMFQHSPLSVAFFLPRYMVDNRSKIGGAVKLDSLQTLVVSF